MVVRNVVRSPVRAVVQSVFGEGESFHPFQLFRSGAQGAWYDPSDYSTLYQDANGTTPVTAVEQPVRLMLDRSRGLVPGSELVSNGDFSSGTTGWTGTNATISEAAGVATVENSGATAGAIHQTLTTVSGRRYVVNFSVASFIGASTVRASANNGGSPSYNGTQGAANYGVGTHTFAFVAAGTTTVLAFYVNSTTVGHAFTIDNISVRELPGNHAVAPNDASRPILRARYNLLRYSQAFDNPAWTATSTTFTTGQTAPDGTATAYILNGSGSFPRIHQTNTVAAGVYILSVYVKKGGSGTVALAFSDVGGVDECSFNIATGAVAGAGANISSSGVTSEGDWWRLFAVSIRTAGAEQQRIFAGYPTNAGATFWGAQLLTAADHAATGGAYQRIGAATDYDTGPPWRPYLAFDGSDDSMSTSSIDFSGTDEMTVFAGVTKLSDAASTVVLGHGVDFSAVGAFEWQANTGANATTAFRGRSSAGSTANAGFTRNVVAPSTFVFAVLVDYAAAAGAEFSGRYNGVVQAQNDGLLQENTGTFGNNVLTIGSRQGGASQRFNGRLYSLAVLGRTATSPELTAMESWIAGKTGVSL